MHQVQTVLLEASKQFQLSPPGIHKLRNIAWSNENMKHVNSPGFIKKCNNATWFLDTEKR
jgi:hypothetical protein